MKPSILTITLNPAVDKTLYLKNFSLGKEFVEERLTLSAGGKGINVSRVLSFLKCPNLATGLLGGWAGELIKGHLEDDKIIHHFVPIKGNTRTSLTIIDESKNQLTRLLEKGPSVQSKEVKAFKQVFKRLLKKSSFVVLSGRNANGIDDSIYYDLIKTAHKHKVPVILDSHSKAFAKALKAAPYGIAPNLKEAEEAYGQRLKSLGQKKKAIRYFHKKGIHLVILSLGPNGAIASDGKMIIGCTPPSIKCINHVGCGDALLAGALYALQKKQSLTAMIRFAVATGTVSAMSVKPGAVSRSRILQLQKKVKVKNLS